MPCAHLAHHDLESLKIGILLLYFTVTYTVTELTDGICCRAKEKQTGKIYALKKIKMERETEGFPLTSIREINILLALHHKNIVNVTEVSFLLAVVDLPYLHVYIAGHHIRCITPCKQTCRTCMYTLHTPVISACIPCKQTCHICMYALLTNRPCLHVRPANQPVIPACTPCKQT